MKSLKSFETHLSELNAWLKRSKIRITVKVDRNRLYLLTSIPKKGKLKQKRFYLGLDAIIENLNDAKKEALKLFGMLANDDITAFNKKEQSPLITIADIIEAFKSKYYDTRILTNRTDKNYYTEYGYCFKELPLDQPLTVDICIEAIRKTAPNSRKREKFITSFSRLLKFAGIKSTELKEYNPKYKIKPVKKIPTIEQIKEEYQKLVKHQDKWDYAILACFGIRPIELHYILDLSIKPIPKLTVFATKTNSERTAYGIPELITFFGIDDTIYKKKEDPSRSMSHDMFKRNGISFIPYMLRHHYAIYWIPSQVPTVIVARWMGHSNKEHNTTYMKYLTEFHEANIFKGIFGDRQKD